MRRFKQYTVEEYLKHLKSIQIERPIREIHLHHTWRPTKKGYERSKKKEEVIYGMYIYHTKTKGWSDIAQHLSLAPDGTLWDGRDINREPASIKGHNKDAFMIEMIGNFDEGNEKLEGAQLDSLVKLLKGLFKIFNTKKLVFHREYSTKTCPGTGVDKNEILEKINNVAEEKVSILGKSEASKEQMKQYLLSINSSPKLNCSVDELIQYYIEEAEVEGVRADVAFAQALKETGYFRYGGIVEYTQNNFAGIGALNSNKKGEAATFSTPRIGIRAQIQHLKGYASKEKPKKDIVDPRYQILIDKELLGSAFYVTDLNGKWAWPGYGYGEAIITILNKILDFEVKNIDYSRIIKDKEAEIESLKNEISKLREIIDSIKKILS